jgi:hypothetical protein
VIQEEPIAREEVSEALADVLGRAEFHEAPSLFEQFLDWLDFDVGLGPLSAFEGLFYALLVVLFVLGVVWLLKRFGRRDGAGEDGRELARAAHEGPEARMFRLKEAADRARAAGDERLALRLLFEALLVALGGRGELEFRPAWTNRELVRRGKQAPEARVLLEELVREFEPKEFGHKPVEARDLARLEELLAPHLVRPRGHGRAA